MPRPDPDRSTPVRRTRSRRIGPALAALTAAALAGCAPDFYKAYRDAHPGWEPTLPHPRGGLGGLVASLHGPDGVPEARVKLASLVVLDVTRQPWRTMDIEVLRGGASADGDYAVIARRVCTATKGGERIQETRVDSYLLAGGRVYAYDHSDFHSDCEVRAKFLAARGDAVPLELAVAAYIRDSYGRRLLAPADLYRRGIGYVEAGRLEEAVAMLRGGEKAFQAAEEAARRPSAPKLTAREREAQAELARLRRRLHDALGIALPASASSSSPRSRP